MRGLTLKNPLREAHLFRQRTVVAAVFAAALMVTLVVRLSYLQIQMHEHYSTLSHNNRVNIQPIAPTRGLIYDRNGIVLAENIPSFSLEIIPEQVDDMEATLDAIEELITISEDERQDFLDKIKYKRRFELVPLRFRLTDEEVAQLSVNRHRLSGVEIKSRLTRYYPYPELTAHSVGYVGRINQQELEALDASNYSATHHIGKVGVEKSYEDQLHGKVGFQQVETNARGRILRVLERTPPEPGHDLHLNIDIRLQQTAKQAFGEERGALVAIEPGTGAVLALVSIPGYDTNQFVNGIDYQSYNELLYSKDKPLFNRALRGQYPPGSTTKPFMGLAGLELQRISPQQSIFCQGYYTLENDDHRYRDWKKEGHGKVDLHEAIVQSCDVFFYDLSLKLGIDRMSEFMGEFGFGRESRIDIPGEASGLMPSRDWKRKARREPWYPGETLITGIGQGFTLATPVQLANATAALAAEGHLYQPLVVAGIVDPMLQSEEPIQSAPLNKVSFNNKARLDYVIKAMTDVVHGLRGTARRIGLDAPYRIAGKTGTAQVFGIKQDEEYVAEEIAKRLRDHALFISFAPIEKPRIAVAVIVENGGSGSAVAAPIARQVMDAYLLDSESGGVKP